MRGIKCALSFVWGLIYAFCIQSYFANVLKDWIVIPIMFVVVSTIIIVAFIINFLVTNWNEL
jgi:hypothetical protein